METALMNGMHTAGIYSDMTVDGPEIGTLVAIVDRAKNLPNVKRMGKQNPYCAARLGKEAKKTETDKRGGQTPKWYALRYKDAMTKQSTDRALQGPGTTIYSPRLARLPQSQTLGLQR